MEWDSHFLAAADEVGIKNLLHKPITFFLTSVTKPGLQKPLHLLVYPLPHASSDFCHSPCNAIRAFPKTFDLSTLRASARLTKRGPNEKTTLNITVATSSFFHRVYCVRSSNVHLHNRNLFDKTREETWASLQSKQRSDQTGTSDR